jgi:hypothetical protein
MGRTPAIIDYRGATMTYMNGQDSTPDNTHLAPNYNRNWGWGLDFTFYLNVAFGYRNGSLHSSHWSPDGAKEQLLVSNGKAW